MNFIYFEVKHHLSGRESILLCHPEINGPNQVSEISGGEYYATDGQLLIACRDFLIMFYHHLLLRCFIHTPSLLIFWAAHLGIQIICNRLNMLGELQRRWQKRHFGILSIMTKNFKVLCHGHDGSKETLFSSISSSRKSRSKASFWLVDHLINLIHPYTHPHECFSLWGMFYPLHRSDCVCLTLI